MIILTIRTDNPLAEIGLYDDNKKIAYTKWEAHRRLAETLHSKGQQLLADNDIELAWVEGIIVFEGPGSFTGLRIGISVANALAYSLSIPIVGVQNEDWIDNGINTLKSGVNALPLRPFYGADANITTPKK